MYARATMVPLAQVLGLFDASRELFLKWKEQGRPHAEKLVAMIDYWSDPMRTGDMAELERRLRVWDGLDDEARLQLLRTTEGA